MTDTSPRSSKATWWVLAIIAIVAILLIVYFATRHSQKVDNVATANGTGQGAAYDETTGNVVPANAAPGALSVGASNSLGAENSTSVGGAAGGTEAAAYGPNGAQGHGTMMPGAGGSGAGDANGAGSKTVNTPAARSSYVANGTGP